MLALRFLDEGEPPPGRFTVAGLVPEIGLTLIVGAEGSGKSMLAAELAGEIADGGSWAGRRLEAGAVLYISPERGAVTRRRLWAIAGADHRIAIASGAFDLRDPAAIAELRQAARQVASRAGLRLALIVIDTLAAATPGLKENETTDVARIGTALGHLSEELSTPIVILHHVRKSDGQARGSSALPAAADAVLRVVADRSGRRLLIPEKISDGALQAPIKFTISEMEGTPRVMWAEREAQAQQPAERLPKSARAALETLKALAEQSGVADIEAWRAALYASWPDKKPGAARQAFADARTRLEAAGLIAIDGLSVSVSERQKTSETDAQASGSGVRKPPSYGVLTLADASAAGEPNPDAPAHEEEQEEPTANQEAPAFDDGWANAWPGSDEEPEGWKEAAA